MSDLIRTLVAQFKASQEANPAASCAYTLASVVMEIAVRAGMDPRQIDVDDFGEMYVRGFCVTNAYPAANALSALAQFYFFDPSNYDGKVHFKLRGPDAVAVVDESEMLDDDQDIEQTKKGDPIQIPRVLHLNYQDLYGGLAPDKQTSERSGDRRATGEISMQTPIVMTADEAAMAITISHKVMIENQKGELKFSLSDKWIKLVPADCIFISWQGRVERVRIIRIDVYDGYQEYTCLRDRQSAYSSSNADIQGFPTAPQTPPPSSVTGPTMLYPLDIALLQDADDGAGVGLYVALSGVAPAWPGATVELSYDGGMNYVQSGDVRLSAIVGELLTDLEDHPQEFPDMHHEFSVRIDTPNGDLFDATLQAMQNRENFAAIGSAEYGWELINFGLADETVQGEWTLSHLLRGRRASGTRHHAAGERFVLLERGFISFQVGSVADIGRTLTLRATTFGAAPETATVVTFTFEARTQIERPVGYLSVRREGADAVVSWQGVARLGGGGSVAHGVRFAGYRVLFSDGVDEIEVDTAAQSVTQNIAALSAPITVSVRQMNDLTGAGPAVEVVLQ